MADEELELVPWLENWHAQTDNPLYAWEAISRSMGSGHPMPEWAIAYLKEASAKMTMLAWGRDFREQPAPKIDADQAMKLVGEALGLWKDRTKNAFERRADDGEAARAGLDADFHDPKHAAEKVKRARTVGDDRAGRIIGRGRRLNSLTR